MTTAATDPQPTAGRLPAALPFWLCLSIVPAVAMGAWQGGLWVLLPPVWTWGAFTVIDLLAGRTEANPDPETEEARLFWHRAVTAVWPLVQALLIFGTLAVIAATDHLSALEEVAVFFGVGIASGTIGITYAHELMHQSPRWERRLSEALLAMVLYSHFRSEHLLVHHRYVGTPRDPVSARYGTGFWRFFPSVVIRCWRSAFRAEADRLARKGLPWHHRSNPFWRDWALQGAMLALALAIGGWWGLALFVVQAATAIWQLELVNYVEHYGLSRKHLGEGRYEPVRPHHSWNATQTASNWLLINLQRHSDHHFKPARRFPLLQTYGADEAPQLPYGYPVMTTLAMVPPLWRRVMDPRVRDWRRRWYPEIADWTPYRDGTTPMPR